MFKNLSPRPDHLSTKTDANSPRNCYSSNNTMNQTERYMLNSSTPRWYFGLPDKNRPRSNNHRKANTSKSDDESDYDYPRESGEYASKIETIKYPPDPTSRKKKPRNDKKTRNALKHSTGHTKNNSLPDWRERVFSEQFQKDFLYMIPMRLRKSLSRNRDRRNLYRRESLRRNSLPESNLRQDIQTPSSVSELNLREDIQTPSSLPELNLREDIQTTSAVPELNLRDKQSALIGSRCCLWSLCIIVGVTLVLAAASVPLILRLTQEKETTYEKYSLQLSTNQTFIVEYNRKSSVPYKAFTERFCSQLERCYQHSDYKDVYYGCFVDMLGSFFVCHNCNRFIYCVYSNGPASTAVNFDTYFQSSSIKQENVVSVLTNCINIARNSSYGHLGEFTITLASLKLISIRYRISLPNIVSISSSSSEMTTTAISDIQSSIVTSYSSITSFSHTINDMITATRSVNQIIDTSFKQLVTTHFTGNDNTVSSAFEHVTMFSISMTQQPISLYDASDTELYSTAFITTERQPEITPTSAIKSKYSEIEIISSSNVSTSQKYTTKITSVITGSFDTATKVTSTTIESYNVNGASTEVQQSSAGFAFTTTEKISSEKLKPSPTLSISASTSIASNDKLEQTTTLNSYVQTNSQMATI